MNPKIESYQAGWARFPGFSLLFDNPGGGYQQTEHGLLLHCAPQGIPAQALLAAIADWARRRLDAENFWRLGLCATPVSSYHVTAWDGLNVALEPQLSAAVQAAARDCFAVLPAASEAERLFQAHMSPVQAALEALLPLRLAASGLRSTPKVGLVVDLTPADAESAERLAAFQACRLSHAEHLAARWGAAYIQPLQPHLTVAYFANPPDRPELDAARERAIADWQAELLVGTEGLTVSFERLHLYVFSDMAKFYRRG